jgi:ribonuclease P protein component
VQRAGLNCRFPTRKSPINTEGRGFRFTREERLKGRDEIRAVFNRGKAVSCPGVKLFVLRSGLDRNRLAVTFARKFGNAVKRNRARRISREAYRLLRNGLKTGFDLAALVYPAGQRPGTAKIRPDAADTRPAPEKDCLAVRMEQFRILFGRAGLFSENR